MEIILLEKVGKLGALGEVVRVKDGFARNFLLPKRKALRATEANKAEFAKRRAEIEKENVQKKSAAEIASATYDNMVVTLLRQASEDGKLFGAISARDVATALQEQGHPITHLMVVVPKPIRLVGVSMVRLVLHPEVTVDIAVNIARTQDEADRAEKAYREKGLDAVAATAVTSVDYQMDMIAEAAFNEEALTDAETSEEEDNTSN